MANRAPTQVDGVLAASLISSVGAAEVISKLAERGMAAEQARTALTATGATIVAFDFDQAVLVGALRPATRMAGLADAVGVTVVMIRESR